jgi:para-nitrobenzyl esterase
LAVALQVISPTASGLFHKAIVQSGAYTFWTGLRSLEDSRTVGRNFATAAGCPDQSAACLRGLSVEAILALEATAGMAPSVDGYVHLRPIKESLESGKFNRVPIFNGTTHDEYVWFQAFAEINTGHVITPAEYPARLAASFGANAAAVEQAYPLSKYDNSAGLALGAATGDNLFICPARNFNIAASKYVPTYAYEFNDPNSPGILPPTSFPLRAAHTHEIQYILRGWKGVYPGTPTPFTPGQAKLSKRMVEYWATFAREGKPHENWPRFSKSKERFVSLEVPKPVAINDFKEDHNCGLWDSFRN